MNSIKIKYRTKLDRRFLVISHGMTKLLNKFNPDVIVASEYNQSVQMAFTWARLHGKKFVSWTDGTIRSESEFKGLRILMRKRIISKANAFIASSSSSRDLQIKYGADPEKIHISYLTVKTDAYKVKHLGSKHGLQIVFVGRLVKGKGLHLLFKALTHVVGDYRLVIVGDGPERASLELLSEELCVEDKVTFVGFQQREAITGYYANSDLFVLPTLNDCFGLVILEAMCASLPVITTIYADGAPDLIVNGESGIILDPNNETEFAKVIQKFIDDKEYAKRLGENGYKRTEIFDFCNVSKEFMGAITQALEN